MRRKLQDGWREQLETPESVDGLNAEFYAKFPYPWPPMKIVKLSDAGFEAAILNQDLGDWSHATVSKSPDIWVAGCGTNQAVLTSLRFPNGTVRGSDLSTSSLEICRDTRIDTRCYRSGSMLE